jgi:hypothetical protein
MKQCRKCKQSKNLTEFFKDAGLKDGRANTCKVCKQTSTYEWRDKNKDKYNEYMRQKNKEAYPEARFQRYGITKEGYEKTLLEQDSKCAICKKPNLSKKRALAVDHHHGSNKIRGIICYNCNRALHAFDDLDLFNAIMAYLKKHQESK